MSFSRYESHALGFLAPSIHIPFLPGTSWRMFDWIKDNAPRRPKKQRLS
jgi:hypothetical protein